MKGILNAMLATNLILAGLSALIRQINKKNIHKVKENSYLIDEIKDKIDEYENFEELCSCKNPYTRRFKDALDGFVLFENTRAIYLVDAITDEEFLRMIEFEEEKIELVQKNLKTYVKWDRTCTDIDTIFMLASMIHIASSFIFLVM